MASAFAPGNISCVFKIIPHPDPSRMHSLGMGFTVQEGVEVTVSEHHETKILFNGQDINFPTVRAVVKRLIQNTDVPGIKVDLTSPLPLGCGFGLSGAASLATAYAINELIALRKENEELAMITHVVEVENRTGLGDVCSQYHGGCLIKLKEGAPLVADTLSIPDQPIYYRYFGPIHTSEVLRDSEQTKRINRAADTALVVLKRLTDTDANPDLFTACFAVAKQFSVESGLLSDTRVIDTIAQIEAAGGVASMIMLGNGVFSTYTFDGATETQLSKNPARLI
jgi:pantoate kinase